MHHWRKPHRNSRSCFTGLHSLPFLTKTTCPGLALNQHGSLYQLPIKKMPHSCANTQCDSRFLSWDSSSHWTLAKTSHKNKLDVTYTTLQPCQDISMAISCTLPTGPDPFKQCRHNFLRLVLLLGDQLLELL